MSLYSFVKKMRRSVHLKVFLQKFRAGTKILFKISMFQAGTNLFYWVGKGGSAHFDRRRVTLFKQGRKYINLIKPDMELNSFAV